MGRRLLLIAAMMLAACSGASDDQARAAEPTEPTSLAPPATSTPRPASPLPDPAPTPEPSPAAEPSPAPTATPTTAIAEEPAELASSFTPVASPDGTYRYLIDRIDGWSRFYIDRGDGPVLAMSDPQDRYRLNEALPAQIDDAGVVRFVHESSGSYRINYVGRIDDTGFIRDVHVAIDGAEGHPAFIYDPLGLEIDLERPLLENAIGIDATVGGWWYLGNTLSPDPACGASTLYADDADGYRRVLPEDTELDTVVAVHAAPVASLSGADAAAFTRSLIISTTCPAEHEGVRLIVGRELLHGGEGSDAPGQSRVLVDEQWLTLPNGSTEVRRVVDLYEIAKEDELEGSTQVLTIEHLTGELETIAISNYGRRIETVARGYRAEEANEIADAFAQNPIGLDRSAFRYQGELAVNGFALADDADHGGDGLTLVVMGHQSVQVLRADAAPVNTSPTEDFGDSAFGSAVVDINGEFLLAVAEADVTAPLLPPLLRWNAANQAWDPVNTIVTQQAGFGAAVAAATPPSPPWSGRSGITDMVAHDKVVWATGWATIDGVIRGVVWRSTNGVDWVVEQLPNIGDGTEYGVAIDVSDLGVMVAIGNWTHFGAGILARPHGAQWVALDFPTIHDANRIARVVNSTGSPVWIHETQFSGPDSIFYSDDFVSWDKIELPALEDEIEGSGFPVSGFWSLAPNYDAGPIAWYSESDWAADPITSSAWQWHTELGRFISTRVPGMYVGSEDGYAVTQQAGTFLVMAASS